VELRQFFFGQTLMD